MSRASSDAMVERIGAHAKVMGALLKRLYLRWRGPKGYRPGAHDMRGPGPKYYEKFGGDHFDSDPPQRPD